MAISSVVCLQYIFEEVKKAKVPGIVHHLFWEVTKHMIFLSLTSDNNYHLHKIVCVEGDFLKIFIRIKIIQLTQMKQFLFCLF